MHDDVIVVVQKSGEDVGEFGGRAIEIAVHFDDKLALVAELLNRRRGVFLVLALFVDGFGLFFGGVYRVCYRDGCDADNPCENGQFEFCAPPENANNCTTFFGHADADKPQYCKDYPEEKYVHGSNIGKY